jgi:hypothetical protein
MKFRIVFWDVLTCKKYLMKEAVRTSETSVDNYFTRQYIPEDNSGLYWLSYPGSYSSNKEYSKVGDK